jgi:hypothetical protein
MTSWPWMEGIEVAIADPIEPVNAFDSRLTVKDLIETNRAAIDQVKASIETNALFDPQKHEDLWILRFVLSHKKNLKDATKAARHALAFRDEHQLDSTDLRFHPVGPHARSEELKRYLSCCSEDALSITLPDPRRGVVGFLNVGSIHQHELVKNLDPKDWLPTFIYITEWTHQWLDYVTRTTGRLTKSVRLGDLKEFTFINMNNEANKRDGAAMGIMEDVYPQLLQTLFICHAPAWIQIPWRILRPLMPKRVVSKMDFINPDKKRNERERLYAYVDEEHLPVRFGGKYEPWPVAFPLPKKDS